MKDTKNKVIGIRVSEEEKKMLEQLARAEGEELSEYIRKRIFSPHIKYELKSYTVDTSKIEEEIMEVKTQGKKTLEAMEKLQGQVANIQPRCPKCDCIDWLTTMIFMVFQALIIYALIKFF